MTILKKQDYIIYKSQVVYWCIRDTPCKECISFVVCQTCIKISNFLQNYNKIF